MMMSQEVETCCQLLRKDISVLQRSHTTDLQLWNPLLLSCIWGLASKGYPEIHPVTSKVYQAEGVQCLPHTESYIVIAVSCTADLIQGHINRL